MNAYFAVFNGHINEGFRKGLAAVRYEFGESGVREIAKLEEAGIMTIFHTPPTPITQLYVDTILEAVNSAKKTA